MPTLQDARRIAQLLMAKDAIERWMEVIDGQDGFISFGPIEECQKEDGSGGDGPWDDQLVLPRNIVIRMFGHEIEEIHKELMVLGIHDHAPEAAAEAL